ncbi:MAG: cyclic nucleotide-binding domain-containing protein [Myxococcaceae bacterium]
MSEESKSISKVDLKRLDLAEVVMKDPVIAAAPIVKLLGRAPFSQSRLRRFSDKAVLMQQHDPGDSLFLVMAGEVRLLARKDKDTAELGTVHRGEVLGEGEAMHGGNRRCSAVAQGQVDVVEIPRSALLQGGALSPAMSKLLADVHAQRTKALDEMHDFLNRW